MAEENKPGTQAEKLSLFENHLRDNFGEIPIDEIDAATVQAFNAHLVAKVGRTGREIGPKHRNNILSLLGNTLRYAEEVGVIAAAPRVRLHKLQAPEIVAWEFDELPRFLAAAEREATAGTSRRSSLQRWLGHQTIAMTMRYVHHVEEHSRPVPSEILAAAEGIADLDERVLAMLGARAPAPADTTGFTNKKSPAFSRAKSFGKCSSGGRI